MPAIKNQSTTTISYDVTYYNTDKDSKNGIAKETVTGYDSTTATAKTIADLGITEPTSKDFGYNYTFAGWSYTAGGSAAIDDGATLSTVDNGNAPTDGGKYSLYAVWTPVEQTYTVKYYPTNTGGTSVDRTLKVKDIASDTLPTATSLGFSSGNDTFDGWAATAGGGVSYNAGAKLNTLSPAPTAGDEISLYAVWESTEFYINYHLEGGSIVGGGSLSNPYTEALSTTTLTTAPSVKREGYTFSGWAVSSATGTKVANADNSFVTPSTLSPVKGNTYNLYALWTENTYTVKFWSKWTGSGSTLAAVEEHTDTVKYSAGGNTTIASIKPSAPAVGDRITHTDGKTYEFNGWYLVKNGTTWTSATGSEPIGSHNLQTALAVSNVTSTDDSLTVFGIWTAKDKITIEYKQQEIDKNTGLISSIYTDTFYTDKNYYKGDTVTIYNNTPTLSGYTFKEWITIPATSGYTKGDTIANVQNNLTLYAGWTPNTVNIKLNAGASDTSIVLNGKTSPTTTVGGTVVESDLVTSVPTRTGYDFAGWALSDNGTVVVGPTDSDASYQAKASDAPSNPGTLNLYATWTKTQYTVRYNANQLPSATDNVNSVKMYLNGSGVTSPYNYRTDVVINDSGFDNPAGLTVVYGDMAGAWYNFLGWGSSAGATTGIASTDQFGTLYAAQNRTDKILDLYAIWEPVTFTVYYVSADTNLGTVSPASDVDINLATGTNASIGGSTATASATGYTLATPTWKDTSGQAAPGVDSAKPQAKYAPSIAALRALYLSGKSEVTYRAYFEKDKYGYTIEMYLQKADGSYNSTASRTWNTNIFQNTLSATYGDTVSYSDLMAEGSHTGQVLYRQPLLATKDGSANLSGTIGNENLFDFDNTRGTLTALITENAADNVLKLYYKRKTYDLTAVFQTEDASGNKTSGAPAAMTQAPSDFLNGGAAATGLRWGDSVAIGTPTTTGYTFSWAITAPSGASSTTPGSSFSLKADDMAKLAAANDYTAELTGTFKVITYTITLNDPETHSFTHSWASPSAGETNASADLKGSSKQAQTKVASDGTLGTWVPEAVDSNTYDYYFAGWKDDADTSATPALISSATLNGMTGWTGNKSYTAVWNLKIVITYDPGDLDSTGKSKAAWTSQTKVLGDISTITYPTVATSAASFNTLYGSDYLDGGNPKGATGWVFAYWTYVGDTSTTGTRYGHKEPYTGDNKGTYYHDGQTTSDGFALSVGKSYTFVAHWVGVTQPVTINDHSSNVKNNPDEYKDASDPANTITISLPTTKSYVTDDVLDLSDYAPTSTPSGYKLDSWKGSDGKTYTTTSTLHVPFGGITLDPIFTEDTVTFTYAVDSSSAGKGSIMGNISGTTTDTVFAVKHNGITDHTATASGITGAYSFVNWTYNSGEVTTDATLGSSNMNIPAGDVLTDRTYYANFVTNKYMIEFATTGTDGSGPMGTVSAILDGESTSSNGFEIDWNTTIPTNGAVNIDVPEGYELDGWLVGTSSSTLSATPQVFGTSATSGNGQGIMDYVVTDNVYMQAHFKVKTTKEYTVNYDFDPGNVSGFVGSSGSRLVAWSDSVVPAAANDASPKQAGFTFDGWFIDTAFTAAVSGTTAGTAGSNYGPDFGTIYNYLASLTPAPSNIDTGAKAITIYAKWTVKPFRVAYDTYGNVPDDTSSSFDNTNPVLLPEIPVTWNAQASTFKNTTVTRGGYKLTGWKATITKNNADVETSALVADTDTFGALANNDDENEVVTLHAIWDSETYQVVYIYNDGGPGKKPVATADKPATRGWAESVNYYVDPNGNTPSIDGFKFKGWSVEYWGGSSYVQGNDITAPGNTTMAAITGGDAATVTSGTPVIKLTAIWEQQSAYYFQDVLVHLDGTYANADATTPKNIDGNSTVYFADYGFANGKTSYDGYDFDNHAQQQTNFSATTPNSLYVVAGTTGVFNVYYIERSYTVQFFNDTPTAGQTGQQSTSDNAWDSAAANLPAITPTKDGYIFKGWFVTDNGSDKELTGSNTLSDVIANAPDAGTVIDAVAQWEEKWVTISWTLGDTNGTLSPAPGHERRNATSTTAIAGITPTAADKYVFAKWTYDYTDELGVPHSGDVLSSDTFATLTDEDGDGVYETLTPQKWIMTATGSTAVWNDITFTAHFVPGDSQPLTLEIYWEDGNARGNWIKQPSITRYDAKDKQTYTVTDNTGASTDAPVYVGYTFNPSLGDTSHLYDIDNASSHTFVLYYEANAHNVAYNYVQNDGTTTQTAPATAAPLASFNGGTYYTGQTLNIAAAPSLTGYTFAGWYLSGNYGGTNVSGTTRTILGTDGDLTIVGTWNVLMRSVHFMDDTSSAAYAANVRVTEPAGGFSVVDGSTVATAVSPAATTLGELPVTYNANGAKYALTGWKVQINGNVQGNTIGVTDPLTYVVNSDVVFIAEWSETFTVTYTHGRHGVFKDDNNNDAVTYAKLNAGVAIDVNDKTKYGYSGTTDSNSTNPENVGKPQAANGWAFVGWGTYDPMSSSWSYYFDWNADVDYGMTVNDYGTAATPPATVDQNLTFVGFYQAQERTLHFSLNEYDSATTTPGHDSTKAYSPRADFVGTPNAAPQVKTGETPTLLGTGDIYRKGYDLIGWTDGSATYTPGSTGQFTMPEVAASPLGSGEVWLFPVFSMQQLNINYAVHSDSAGKGGVDRIADSKTSETDTIFGSMPAANPGYEFDYWTLDTGTDHMTSAEGLDDSTSSATYGKLTPSVSGTYYVHFKDKKYNFAYDADPAYKNDVTQPTDALPTDSVWTTSITLGEASRPGYDFTGWDVYESADWTTNGMSATKLHASVADGSHLVSALSSTDGNATSLVLVPTFAKSVLGVTYHGTDGTWSATGADYPTNDPMNDGSTTNPEAKIEHVIDEQVDLRQAAALTRAGWDLVGWQDTATTPNKYYIDSAAATAAGTTAVTYFTMGSVNVDLYPIWQAKEAYEVTFVDKPDGDTGTTPVDSNSMPNTGTSLKWADNVDVQKNDGTTYSAPVRPGYTFDGWTVYASDYNTVADKSTATVIGGTDTTPLTGTKYAFSDLAKTDTAANQHLYLVANWSEASDYQVVFVDRPASDTSTDAVTGMPTTNPITGLAYAATGLVLPTPARNGYTFQGWADDVTGTTFNAGTEDFATLANNSDANKTVTLYATWAAKTDYQVKFDLNAGSETVLHPVATPQTGLAWGGTVNLQNTTDNADPSRLGFTFSGWTVKDKKDVVVGNTDSTPVTGATAIFSTLANNDDSADNAELTLYAVWTPKSYSVIFDADANGDASVAGMPGNRTGISFAADDIDAHAPTRTGYVFLFWSNSVTNNNLNAGTNITYTSLVANDDDELSVTLTANWKANEHNLTYVAGTGDTWSTAGADFPAYEPTVTNSASHPEAAIATEFAAVLELRTNNAIKHVGSTLLGWANGTDKNAIGYTEYLFSSTSTITMPDADVTLYPLWQEVGNYNVNFLAGDATGATKVVPTSMPTKLENITFTKSDIDGHAPTRPGYTFAGWSDDATSPATIISTANGYTLSALVYSDLANNDGSITTVNLTAQWTPNAVYYVTYSDGVSAGSIAYSGATVAVPGNRSNIEFDASDIKQTELASADRKGYTFTGWLVTNDTPSHAGYKTVLATVTSGFSTDAVYSALVGGDDTITNIAFTATWEGATYTVTYNLTEGNWETTKITDGGAADPGAAISYKTEQNVVLRKADTVTRAGFDLIGWKNGTDDQAAGYAEYKFAVAGAFVMPNNDVDLYPIWDAIKYQVTFAANDADGAIKVTAGTMPANQVDITYETIVAHGQPTRDGYQFGGWDVTADTDPSTVIGQHGAGSTEYSVLADNDPSIRAITLTAAWTKQPFTVTYVLTDGEGSWVTDNITDSGKAAPKMGVTYDVDDTVNLRLADTVARKGYVLTGWQNGTDDSVAGYVSYVFGNGETSFTMPGKNVVLYPMWDRANYYSVTFDHNWPTTDVAPGAVQGNLSSDQAGLQWDGAASMVTITVPTFTGYTFKYWNVVDANGDDVPADNNTAYNHVTTTQEFYKLAGNVDEPKRRALKLVAEWEPTKYNVRFTDGVNTGEAPVDAGTMPSDQTGITYTTVVNHSDPTRKGYTFNGWRVVDATSLLEDTLGMLFAPTAGSIEYYKLTDPNGTSYNAAITSLRLDAIWAPKSSYSVSFDLNASGDTVTRYPSDVAGVKWDDTIITKDAAGDPKRAGWAFQGWIIKNSDGDPLGGTDSTYYNKTSESFANLAQNDDVAANAALTLVAQWGPISYSVTFEPGDSNGATKVDMTTMPYASSNYAVTGLAFTALVDRFAPTRAGYDFVEWTSSYASVSPVAGSSTQIAYTDLVGGDDEETSVTLTATWSAKTIYNVYYNAGDAGSAITYAGTLPGDRTGIAYDADDVEQTALLDSDRLGYTFLGWKVTNTTPGHADEGAELAVSPVTSGFADAVYSALANDDAITSITYTAMWEAIKYEVTYHIDGYANTDWVEANITDAGASTPNLPVEYAADSTVALRLANTVVRAGYVLAGWNDGTDDMKFAEGTTDFTMPAGNVDLYPVWDAKTYSVTFDGNEASVGAAAGSATVPANLPVSPDELHWGSNVAATAATLAGFTFDGWTIYDKAGNVLSNTDTSHAPASTYVYSVLAGNVDSDETAALTLFANWTAKTYTVIFATGDGTGATKVDATSMPYNDNNYTVSGLFFTANDIDAHEPTRAGYDFGGWLNSVTGATEAAANAVAYADLVNGDDEEASVTLTATWSAKTIYNVTYADGVPGGSTVAFGGTLPQNRTGIGFDTDDIEQTELNIGGTDRPGFVFTGWKITNDADGSELATSPVTSGYANAVYSALVGGDDTITNITYTAMWEGAPFTVTYHRTDGEWVEGTISDAGAATPDAAITYKNEQIVALRLANTIVRDGYELTGWYDGTTDMIFANGDISFSMPGTDVDLYPVWNAKSYSVYFDASTTDAVSQMPADVPSTTWNATVSIKDAAGDPKRAGYTFLGWTVKNTAGDVLGGTDSAYLNAPSAVYSSMADGDDTADNAALTLFANWIIRTYAVNFLPGDDAEATKVTPGTMPESMSGLAFAADDIDAHAPTRVGYDFVNWASDVSAVPTVAAANAVAYTDLVNGDDDIIVVNLTATWSAKMVYNVAYDANDAGSAIPYAGTLPGDRTGIAYDADDVKQTALLDSDRLGYTFLGWKVTNTTPGHADEGAELAVSPVTSGFADAVYSALANDDTITSITYTAMWEAIKYHVTYHEIADAEWAQANITDAGASAPNDPVEYAAEADVALRLADTVMRAGFELVGWNDGTTDMIFADGDTGFTMPAADVELYPVWNAKLYNVHFVEKPATDTNARPVNMNGLVDLIAINWDTRFDAAPAPTRSGFSFDHWAVTNTTDPADVKSIGQATAGYYYYYELAYDYDSATDTKVQNDNISDITLTAVWVPNKHTVKYVVDTNDTNWVQGNITDAGASTPNDPVTYEIDADVALRLANTVVRAGYVLTGWYDDADPVNTYVFADGDTGFIMPDEDVQLFPTWRAKEYTVKFEEGDFTVYDAALQVVSGMPANPQEHLLWASDVDTANPTLTGYTFAGWLVEDAASTGANTSTLMNATYKFNELALTDTDAHSELTLVAQWTPAKYRVTYVDPTDANGAEVATPAIIASNADLLWAGNVSDDNPWNVYGASYAAKAAADWQFDGWQVLDASTGARATIATTVYSTLAALQGMTVANVATDGADPALVLYASWTRRVPFVVDFVKVAKAAGGTAAEGFETIESSIELKGLDGQVIDTTTDPMWLAQVLDMGDGHSIVGYAYNRDASAADARNLGKALDAATQLGADNELLHLVLLYDQRLDYQVTYIGFDGTGGWLAADMPAQTTQTTGASPAWETPGANFAPVDADWFYRGHKIDYWTYGPTGTENVFDAADGMTFARIAEAIYGTVDGTEGTAAADGTIAKPVELHAVWSERSDYKVVYDDNYKTGYENNGIVDKFLGRIGDLDAAYTPGDTDDVEYSSSSIEPTVEDGKIVEPGVKSDYAAGDLPLYKLVGWNYSATGDGNNQKPAEGKTFEQIVEEIASNQSDPLFDPESITLYARWEEVPMEIKYTTVRVEFDEATGQYVEVAGTAGGTVSRASETIDRAISWTADPTGNTMIVRGATVTVNPGWHFVGWKRVSDGEIVYADGWDPASEAARLAAQAATDGNVMPSSLAGADTLFAVMQNSDDGYWHSEEYQALFAQNDAAVLHYDKNADDATGTIDDVEEPYGTLIDLSDGSPFKRDYWKLVGWNTESDGSGTDYELGEKDLPMPEGDTTLYAQWEKVPAKVTYNTNGSGVTGMPESETKEWGNEYEISDKEPARKHYVFTGWNTKPDGTGESYEPGDEYLLEGAGITLYAQWELAKFDVEVTEPAKGGTVTVNGDVSEVAYGSYVPKGMYTAEPEDGYHLVKWRYRMVDEDGNVRTGYVSDPSKLKVLGQVTFEPVFAKNKAEKPAKPENPKKPNNNQRRNRATNRGTTAGVVGTTGGYLARTADTLGLAISTLLTAALAAMATLLALLARRKRESN